MREGENRQPQAERVLWPLPAAMQAAKKIVTKRPDQDQKDDLANLCAAIDKLNEDGRRTLVFRLMSEVLEEMTPIQSLFAAARYCRMQGVAFNTAAVKTAMREGNLTLSDLRDIGLAEIRLDKERRPYVVYYVGHERLLGAARKLRQAGNAAAAQVLETHLRREEKNRLLAEFAKEAQAATEEAPEKTKA